MTTSTQTRTEGFVHTMTTPGPAAGSKFSGNRRLPAEPAGADTPLIVALPGGTYTSTYFDVPGFSLLVRAAAAGVPTIAIDRPGYGDSTPVGRSDSIILTNAEVLEHLIAELWEEYGADASGVVLIGHSIGGAIATAIAARQPRWPLLGLAVSGCLLEVPSESRAAWDALPDTEMVELPGPMKDFVMFGPDWTHSKVMPAASHVADAPVPLAELLDITGGWIGRVRSVAANVTVPVHTRQGEFDKLWITDEQQVSDFGAAFTSAPAVDARLVRSAGHCIDFHRRSAAFQFEQLAFALGCCIKPQ